MNNIPSLDGMLFIYETSIIIAAALPGIAVMASSAGCGVQGFRVTRTTSAAAVIDPAAAVITVRHARVWTSIAGCPIFGRMAGGAVDSEKSRMVGRVTVAACTRARDPDILPGGMTAFTRHTGMPTDQREAGCIVVKL